MISWLSMIVYSMVKLTLSVFYIVVHILLLFPYSWKKPLLISAAKTNLCYQVFLLFTVPDISERSKVSSSCVNKAHFFGKLPSYCFVVSWCYLGAHIIESHINPRATALFFYGIVEEDEFSSVLLTEDFKEWLRKRNIVKKWQCL